MILDTNAVTAILDGDVGITGVVTRSTKTYLPVPVLGEYRFGLKSSRDRVKLGNSLQILVAKSDILGTDFTTAEYYADIRHELKLAGKPIPENDLWIAALARQHSLDIVSNDTHFDHVAGLKRRGW